MPDLSKLRKQFFTLTFASAGSVSFADIVPDPNFVPNTADLRHYLACNALAETRLPSYGEASTCGIIFERLKLSFVTDLTFEDFTRLSYEEKSDLSLRGYRALHDWLEEHQTVVELLKKEIGADQAPIVE